MLRSVRRWSVAAIAGIAVGAASLVIAPQASAATSACASGDMCFYYNSGRLGAEFGWPSNISDFSTTFTFTPGSGGSNGAGVYVKNNAASAWNRVSTNDARVYFNSAYLGSYDIVCRSLSRNLDNTKNNNASFKWLSSPEAC